MGATLKDISAAANASISTVSNIINRRPIPYAQETRNRVLRVAQDLNYRPNTVARGLRSGRTDTLGLVIPNRRYSFFADIAIAVEKFAKQQSCHVVTVFCTDNEEVHDEHLAELETLTARQVDGIVIVPPGQNEHVIRAYQKLVKRDIPLVLMDQDLQEVRADFVGTDDVRSARDAVEYLLSRGHRRIAHLSGAHKAVSGQGRLEGYRMALKEAGLAATDELVFGRTFAEVDFIPAVAQLLETRPLPTAVFCAHDLMAAELYKQCWQRGIRIPEDISVVGYCGFMLCEYLTPPLTTMVQPVAEMAHQAMKLLFERIAEKENPETPSEPRRVYLPAERIERHSVRSINEEQRQDRTKTGCVAG